MCRPTSTELCHQNSQLGSRIGPLTKKFGKTDV